MEPASKYDPRDVESRWYQYWLDNKMFSSSPDGREPYTVVIPPPNVTGVLHMGHMLNNTIQDILVRRARMEGRNACWVPGTDHASIATEAKVVAKLAERGIAKADLSREEFLSHAWDWTREHGGMILRQLRRLGASCDWDRTAFTMDEKRSRGVTKVFCDLYDKGLIYRGARMVNWDPEARTALSDEEVIYREEHSKLYYLRYMVVGEPGKYALVATTRPETIMGDTAVCINPDDGKNAWLKGRRVVVPLVGREVPIIEDGYVDMDFGTGCLKVTPAHDVNDHALGIKHNLETIDIFNDDGTLSEAAGLYVGMDRMEARRRIEADLGAAGLLERVEDYDNKVGYSERTNVPIEPKLSTQWFLSMGHFADMALPPVMDGTIRFHPAKYRNIYRHWMENIKDWCISRQLWWGHRIPAYYLPDGSVVVAESPEKALEKARQRDGMASLEAGDLRQDEDCLDTWFSSWLWPISVFDGINDPGNGEMGYYYPTSDLVTAPDIIFFWVARMIMAGYEYGGTFPFRNVYFTGIVRDKNGRKMSKSLGNSPDPIDLMDRYGADGVRMGMMLSAPAGNDILFDEALCEQGRNFNNKIWNAFRLVRGWQAADVEQPDTCRIATEWFSARLKAVGRDVAGMFGKYRLSEALMAVYLLFWDDFSSWYLEMVKPAHGQPVDRRTHGETVRFLCELLKALHPFMPFITEEIWQRLGDRAEGDSIMRQRIGLGEPTARDTELCAGMESARQLIGNVRTIRSQRGMSPREPLRLVAIGRDRLAAYAPVVLRMANLTEVAEMAEAPAGSVRFLVGTMEYAVPMAGTVDREAERARILAQLDHLEGFIGGIERKLSNARFVESAPQAVVERERKKLRDAREKTAALRASLEGLG